jgi:hypothetical protein
MRHFGHLNYHFGVTFVHENTTQAFPETYSKKKSGLSYGSAEDLEHFNDGLEELTSNQ